MVTWNVYSLKAKISFKCWELVGKVCVTGLVKYQINSYQREQYFLASFRVLKVKGYAVGGT
jgi:hypothetical protein